MFALRARNSISEYSFVVGNGYEGGVGSKPGAERGGNGGRGKRRNKVADIAFRIAKRFHPQNRGVRIEYDYGDVIEPE